MKFFLLFQLCIFIRLFVMQIIFFFSLLQCKYNMYLQNNTFLFSESTEDEELFDLVSNCNLGHFFHFSFFLKIQLFVLITLYVNNQYSFLQIKMFEDIELIWHLLQCLIIDSQSGKFNWCCSICLLLFFLFMKKFLYY